MPLPDTLHDSHHACSCFPCVVLRVSGGYQPAISTLLHSMPFQAFQPPRGISGQEVKLLVRV
jgi:hypothetical protein